MVLVIAICLALTGFLVGCARPAMPTPAPTPTPKPAAPTPTPVSPTPTPPPSKKVVLGYSPPTMTMTDYYLFNRIGLENKAEELGLEMEIITKAPTTHAAAEEQLRIVEDFITAGVDYMWLIPVTVEAVVPMADNAKEAGIPLIISHFVEPIEGVEALAYVGTDFTESGKQVGEFIADYLEGTGVAALMQGAPGIYNEWRVGEAQEVLNNYPDMEVIASEYTEWDTQKALTQASTLLDAHPDVGLIYCPSATITLGVVEAVENAGLAGEVAVVDYDLIPDTIKLASEGKVVAGLGLTPWKYGEIVAEIIAKHQAGEPVDQIYQLPTAVYTADEIPDVYPDWYIHYYD
jgi:ribose transport system substrate-binding protein